MHFSRTCIGYSGDQVVQTMKQLMGGKTVVTNTNFSITLFRSGACNLPKKSMAEVANEAELKEECRQFMRRVAHKRSTYPEHCAKYVSKTLQCKIDQLVSAATKASTPTASEDDWKITDELIEDSHKRIEKIQDSLQEARAILKVLNQISEESSCEMDLIMQT